MWFKYVTSTLLLAIVICCVPNSFASEYNANKYRYLASVRVDDIHFCTGTIIDPNWILTANSCIPPETQVNRITIQYGVQKLTRSGGIPIGNLVRYPFWNISKPYIGDIALISLQKPIVFNIDTDPVRLRMNTIDFSGKLLALKGWTLNINDTDYSFGDKQAITLTGIDKYICADELGFLGSPFTNICTKYDGDVKTHPCFLFGGPLMYNGMQVGFASRQQGTEYCAIPNVYTRVSFYEEWIRTTMWKL